MNETDFTMAKERWIVKHVSVINKFNKESKFNRLVRAEKWIYFKEERYKMLKDVKSSKKFFDFNWLKSGKVNYEMKLKQKLKYLLTEQTKHQIFQ